LFGQDDSYVKFLVGNKLRKFFCCYYPSNPGDHLIRKGAAQLLANLQIQTTNNPQQADFLLFPGGCPSMWPAVMNEIVRTIEKFPDKKIVIGPSTFEYGFTNWPEILSRYADRFAGLFCRDKRSFQNLINAKLPETIVHGLSHDLSLYLKDSEWLTELKSNLSEEYILVALRRDHEMYPGLEEKFVEKILPVMNEKIARKILHWARKRAKRRKVKNIARATKDRSPIKNVDIWLFEDSQYLRTICSAKQVHTDRLHVMIVSAMLGKKVFAYKTLYDKLENVYEHSLKGWADVTFVGR
jgi:exopolysaccharide biosynthesis predicted pyruvyltransferase EpsI